ncbi:NEDD4-binding protein 2-like 1 isoform X2 [Arapaima gigas]
MTMKRRRPHLYIMRGLPGAGKSTRARKIQTQYGGNGVILSTDDFFRNENGVMENFDRELLPTAHQRNKEYAWFAMKDQIHPVIIDNTNISCWEMKPYVKMGLHFGYHIRFCYMNKSWRLSVEELSRRTGWKVPKSVIWNMKQRYEFIDSIYDILNAE